jgi:hypothetical protein
MTRTTIAARPKNGAVSGSRGIAGALDLQSLITLAEPRMVAVRRLANDLMAVQLPEHPDQYPDVLDALPPQQHFADAVAMLDNALSQPATPDEALTLIALLLDGLNHKVGAATKARITAMVIALQPADVLIDDEVRTKQISTMVLGATIARMFRRAKTPPLPSELLSACLATRAAVEQLLEYAEGIEEFSLHMRTELQCLIAESQPGYVASPDEEDRIPCFENYPVRQ